MKNIVFYITSLVLIIAILFIAKTKFLKDDFSNNVSTNLNKNTYVEAKAEVEILNGCGVVGLASKVSDLLRDNNIDVVRSENADNFNYTQTMLILRNENLEELNYVAKSLGLNPTEDPRVIHQPDESLSVDLTLILGKDFSSIKSIQAYIDK